MSEPTLPICQHIKINGSRCQVQAMQGRSFCHFHDEAEKRRRASARIARRLANRTRRTINIPILEDANAVQVALMETMHALIDQRLDRKDAGLLLYALQTASANVKSLQLDEAPPQWTLRDKLMTNLHEAQRELERFKRWEQYEIERSRDRLKIEVRKELEEEEKMRPQREEEERRFALQRDAVCAMLAR